MRALLIVVASVLLMVFALLVGPYVVSTSKFKGEIISGVGSFVKGDVYVGSFSFKILPYPKFTIKDLTVISRESSFQGMPFIKADLVEGGLSPNALMHGKIIADVAVRNLLFDFRISGDGTKNTVIPFFESPAGEKRSGAKLRSLRVENGTFYYVKGEETKRLEQIRLEATGIKHDNLTSAAIRMTALLKGEVPQSFDLSGVFSINREEKVFELKRFDLYFAGARFNLEGMLQYGVTPGLFDVHAATSSFDISSITPFVSALSSGLPLGLKISGPMALDISLKGTKENTSFKIHADATKAEINSGSVFAKKTNFPFKFFLSGVYQPAYATVDDATISFGSSSFRLTGSVFKQQGYPVQISIEPTSFAAGDVVPSFPLFAIFEELSNPSASLEIKGPILEETQRIISGKFSSEKAVVFGQAISNMNTDFTYSGGIFSFSAHNASMCGGTMSGNGQITMGEVPAYRFDIVADNIDMSKISGSYPILKGTGSLIFKAQTMGSDSISLKDNLISEGTIVVPQGEVAPFKAGRDVLTESVWNIIKAHVPQGLESGVIEELSAAGGEIKDLKISFGSRDGIFTADKINWSAPKYEIEAKLSINRQDVVSGEGDVFIESEEAARLIKDPAERKNVTTGEGKLVVPFMVGGTLSSMSIRPSETKLANNLKGIEAPAPVMPLPGAAESKPYLQPVMPPAQLAPLMVPGQVPAPAPAATPVPPEPQPAAPAAAAPVPVPEVPTIPPVAVPPAPVSPPAVPPVAAPTPQAVPEAAPKKRAAVEKQEPAQTPAKTKQKKTKMQGEVDEDVFKVLVGD